MLKYYFAIGGAVLFNVGSQLLLKKGVMKGGLNRFVVLGYFLLIVVLVLSVFVLQRLRLIEMIVITPLIHLMVIFASRLVFKEKLSTNQWLAILIMILGIIVINLKL